MLFSKPLLSKALPFPISNPSLRKYQINIREIVTKRSEFFILEAREEAQAAERSEYHTHRLRKQPDR
jgi:hypothetical protein